MAERRNKILRTWMTPEDYKKLEILAEQEDRVVPQEAAHLLKLAVRQNERAEVEPCSV